MIRNNIFFKKKFIFNIFYSHATILYVANMIYYPRHLYCYHFVEDMILELYDFRIFRFPCNFFVQQIQKTRKGLDKNVRKKIINT